VNVRPRVILVTEPGRVDRLRELADVAPSGRADLSFAVHLRFAEGLDAALATRARLGVPFVASVAPTARMVRELALDGVHLGGERRATLAAVRAELGPNVWISVPAHTDQEVDDAVRGGATAAYVSPIFATPGKGPARGLDAIARARARVPAQPGATLLYALGGVDADTAEACVAAGADGVAVIRAFSDAADCALALRALDNAVVRGLASRTAS
jgi:thiamine-phosphate pyrophosphorylase